MGESEGEVGGGSGIGNGEGEEPRTFGPPLKSNPEYTQSQANPSPLILHGAARPVVHLLLGLVGPVGLELAVADGAQDLTHLLLRVAVRLALFDRPA